MSKILKLVNLVSYVNARTNGEVVKKGETAHFSDEDAAKIMGGARVNGEGETAPYWVEVEGVAATYDFRPAEAVTADADEAPPARATRQRKPR